MSLSRTGRIFFAAMVLASALLLLSSAWAAPGPEGVTLRAEGPPARLRVTLEVQDWTRRTVSIRGRSFQVPLLPGESLLQEAGAPALPRVCRSLLLPPEGSPEVRVLEAAYREVAARIAPSKGPLPRTQDPAEVPYVFGPVYGRNGWFPEAPARLRKPYLLRDRRGVVLELHPFRYNPAAGLLRIYTRLVVEVQTKGSGGVNPLPPALGSRRQVQPFEALARHRFLNLEGASGRYDPLDEEGGILAICHDPWKACVQPLVEFRKAQGYAAALVGVSEIGNDPDLIRAFIRQAFETSDLAFVLLVGDAEQVAPPHVELGGGEVGASDATYALLAGGDTYPEIMVGRFSAGTEEEVVTQVERTVAYELEPATAAPWFWRGTGIGSDQGPGDDGEMDWEHIDNIRTLLLAHGYTEVDPIYDPGATAGQVVQALEAGRGIVNYCGHGGPGGWGTSGFVLTHLEALLNPGELPFVFSVACGTGDFEGKTGMGESFPRVTLGGGPTGGIGFYGGSAVQYWSEPMEAQDAFNLCYTAGDYQCLGTLCYAGSCSMMDKYGASGADMFLTWELFGDPALHVTGTAPPPAGLIPAPYRPFIAKGPPMGPFHPRAFTWMLENRASVPIAFTAAADAEWLEVHPSAGVVPAGGAGAVTVEINGLAGSLPKGTHEAWVHFQDPAHPEHARARAVILHVGVPVPVYTFDLDEDPGWTVTGEWAFGRPAGKGGVSYGYPDPASGATGDQVYGVNLEGDYSPDPGGPFHLTTTAIDCSDLVQVHLRFARWLNSDFQPYFFSTVEASNDGQHWVTLWENPGSEIAEHAWKTVEYDLSAVADRQPEVYIRWGYEKGSPAYPYSGWNIDDVEILGVEAPLAKKSRKKPVH